MASGRQGVRFQAVDRVATISAEKSRAGAHGHRDPAAVVLTVRNMKPARAVEELEVDYEGELLRAVVQRPLSCWTSPTRSPATRPSSASSAAPTTALVLDPTTPTSVRPDAAAGVATPRLLPPDLLLPHLLLSGRLQVAPAGTGFNDSRAPPRPGSRAAMRTCSWTTRSSERLMRGPHRASSSRCSGRDRRSPRRAPRSMNTQPVPRRCGGRSRALRRRRGPRRRRRGLPGAWG